LTIEFDQFLPTLKKMLLDCEQRPNLYKIFFTMDDEDGNAVMKFSHDNEIRRSDLLALDNFRQLDDDLINTQVGFRINSLK
jgi:hypothetical protein